MLENFQGGRCSLSPSTKHLSVLLEDFCRGQDSAADKLSAAARRSMDGRLGKKYRGVWRNCFGDPILQGLVGCKECAGRGNGDKDDGTNALVETTKQRGFRLATGIFV